MIIKINSERQTDVKKISAGYNGESRVLTLEFDFPSELQDFNKIIEFEIQNTCGCVTEKMFDAIVDNKYEVKSNISKYPYVFCQITFTKQDGENVTVYKTNKFSMQFTDSINAVKEIDPESEEVNVLNTLINSVEVAINEVKELGSEIIPLMEETRLNSQYAREQGDYAKENAETVTQEIDKLETMVEEGKFNGATYTPNVDDEGNISWQNDKGLINPETKNIKGEVGTTPRIKIGEVITLVAGSKAVVTLTGTLEEPVLNFGIPRGESGEILFKFVSSKEEVTEEGVLYFVPKAEPQEDDYFDEYALINGKPEIIGSAKLKINLDNYYTKDEINTILFDYITSNDLEIALADYVKNTDHATETEYGVVELATVNEIDKGTGGNKVVTADALWKSDYVLYEDIPDVSNFLDKKYTGTSELAGKIQIGNNTTNITNALLHIRNVGSSSITGKSVNGACFSVNSDGTASFQHKIYNDDGSGAKNSAVLRFSNKGIQFAINTGGSTTPTEAMYKELATQEYVDTIIGNLDQILIRLDSGEGV